MDVSALERETERLTAAGVHGLSFAGSTGEGAVLTDAELAQGVETVQRANKHRLPLLCGIIRNSTRQGISAAQAAKQGGANALMGTPTYYLGASPKDNGAYFRAIHQATGLPIVIYNVIRVCFQMQKPEDYARRMRIQARCTKARKQRASLS